jgi:ABC-type transport system substrate-binding protein
LYHGPSTLDPAYIQDLQGATIAHQLFDRLIQFGPYLDVLPSLAESWRMEEDGTAYRFFLRRGVRFHDGKPMDADDVIFSLKRLIRAEPQVSILPHILKIRGAKLFRDGKDHTVEGLQAIDKNTLLIRLSEPHVPFLTVLGSYQASIVPKDAPTGNDSRFNRHPIGTGPFEMVFWEPEQLIKLERFSNYYGGPAYLDGIEYRIYPGAQIDRMLADFRAKKIEEVQVVGPIQQQLGEIDKYKHFRRPALNLFFYGMNCRHPELSDVQLRKALFQSLDRKKMIHEILQDRFETADSILPPGMPGYSPARVWDDEPVPKSVLDRIASASPTIEIVSAMTSPNTRAELDFVSRSWSKIGVRLKVKYIPDWKEFERYIQTDDVQIYRYDWTADMPDPDSFLYPLFASDSPTNYMRYRNDQVDDMLLKARGITDPVKRAALYQKIEMQIMQDVPIIPFFNLSVDRVFQPYVQGVQISALGTHSTPMHHIWLSQIGGQ